MAESLKPGIINKNNLNKNLLWVETLEPFTIFILLLHKWENEKTKWNPENGGSGFAHNETQ